MFGRDQWISLQSAAETTLFQKTQSGGILLGREHMMFARHYSILKNEEKGDGPRTLPPSRALPSATRAG